MVRFSEGEVRYIFNNYKDNTYEKIGEVLGRTAKSIFNKASKLGITKVIPNRRWIHEEVIRVIELRLLRWDTKEIARELKRTERAVILKLHRIRKELKLK